MVQSAPSVDPPSSASAASFTLAMCLREVIVVQMRMTQTVTFLANNRSNSSGNLSKSSSIGSCHIKYECLCALCSCVRAIQACIASV